MISALMRKLAPDDGNAHQQSSSKSANVPAGINRVGAELQRKFAGGIDYNMKIVIRGDRNTGKTALWRRLQGLHFLEAEEGDGYTQTEQIQVMPITWNYKASEFVVKLDVWDVVDKGRRAADTLESGLKLASGKGSPGAKGGEVPEAVQNMIGSTACDASTVNVYSGCHGVVLMFDVTREWTWAYVRRELPNVPAHIPVLVMANKTDLLASSDSDQSRPAPSSSSCPTIDECLNFLRVFNERVSSSSSASADKVLPVRFVRASMKRAQGLKFLYNFFNIPFLLLQRNFLENALQTNLREMQIAEKELDILGTEEGQNLSTKWRRDDEGDEDEEEEEDDGEDEWKKTEEKNEINDECPKMRRSRSKSEEVEEEDTSSSEGANPHVSTYAEDISDAED